MYKILKRFSMIIAIDSIGPTGPSILGLKFCRYIFPICPTTGIYCFYRHQFSWYYFRLLLLKTDCEQLYKFEIYFRNPI